MSTLGQVNTDLHYFSLGRTNQSILLSQLIPSLTTLAGLPAIAQPAC